MKNWEYSGDINLEYGGYFYRHDLDDHGFPYYTDVIRITNLADCGADGLTLVEFISLFDLQDKDKVRNSLSYIGFEPADLRKMGKDDILALLTQAYLAYGYYHLQSPMYSVPDYFVLVNDSYGRYSDKGKWDGWEVDDFSKAETVRLHKEFGGDLELYVKEVWLNE